MKSLKLLTWLDVRRTICRQTNYGSKLPEGVTRIRCFSDAVEIGLISETSINNTKNTVKSWFGDWYQENDSLIQLDIGDATLPVEFIPGESPTKIDISVRPFWEEIAYVESESELETKTPENVTLPQPFTENPNLLAFYSFKGGVGRTLNLAAHIFALVDRAKELNKPVTLLVIDADLEAPGLTYWHRAEKQQPAVSFIDFLEAYHYSPIDTEETLSIFAREVKKSSRNDGNATIYFLPACLEDEELLDTPILPENLVRSPDGKWECGNAIHRLGKAVGADYVFIDLRAGLSEISSPIIFDPRIQRFLVTTINDQSVTGTSLVLKQIGRVAPPEKTEDDASYYDPSLIVSMLPEELKSSSVYEAALIRLQSAYVQPQEDNIYSTRLEITESYFAQELLYINNWEEARGKLNPTSVMKIARDWAELQLQNDTIQPSYSKPEESDLLEEVRKLKELCQRYEYAEAGEGEDLLVTEALKNLAANFRDELPRVVSIGAKGAGKTFNYIQLSRLQSWEKFLNRIENSNRLTTTDIMIFPLLQSTKLGDNAKNIINEARSRVKSALSDPIPEFIHSEYVDRIKRAIAGQNWSEPQWAEFWIGEIARALGINPDTEGVQSLSSINRYLKDRELRLIFLFDGLEDIFPNIALNSQEKIALKSLIEDIPNKLSEIRQSNLGAIVFLRRDFLRHAIAQNLKQFEHLYRAYDLSWNQDSFLRLVFWLCRQSEVITENDIINIDSLAGEDLKERIEQIWGKRLGTDKAKEAYTHSWIFAALTDFNGRLQARDIVRFLYHAADITVNNAKKQQFSKWLTSRLLPPEGIRRALKPCSEKKVEEAKEEYPAFKQWVEDTLPKYPPNELKIPFAVEQFNMDQPTVRMLKEMGVIYEDTEKEDTARFYMPEIFREGLGFSLAQRAIPRVLVLKRKALGREIV